MAVSSSRLWGVQPAALHQLGQHLQRQSLFLWPRSPGRLLQGQHHLLGQGDQEAQFLQAFPGISEQIEHSFLLNFPNRPLRSKFEVLELPMKNRR